MTEKKRSVVNIGTISMFVIFIGLCLAVLAALSISSARNDYRLSQTLAEHTQEYYQAVSEAQLLLADTEPLESQASGGSEIILEVPMNESQTLRVTAAYSQVEQRFTAREYQVIYTQDWQGEDILPVQQEP